MPEKVGLKAIQRDDVSYEFTIVFDVDSKHLVRSSKDRTNLFTNSHEFKISEETGRKILKWCESGINNDQVLKRINECKTENELKNLYEQYPDVREELVLAFKQKRSLLQNHKSYSSNGKDVKN